MKKFLQQLLIFSLPIFLLSYLLDVFVSATLKKSNSYAAGEYSTWNAIIDGKVNSTIVVYGSSRAWVQINPTMISDSLKVSAYNLGIDGHNFWLQYLRHSLLLKKNTKPRLIIHSLDIFTLDKVKDLYNAEQFLPYMLWNNEVRKATIGYNGYNLLDYEIPLIRYNGKQRAIDNILVSLVKNPQTNTLKRVKGYEGKDEQWNADFSKTKEAMKNFEVKFDTSSIALFDKYLNECKSKNINIIFVYTPEYIEGQKFIKNRDKLMEVYVGFAKKYHIPFYDFSYDSISYQKKYFYNALHMNKDGAELFTKKLIDTLKQYNTLYK